jgi:hypothetical protein
MKFVERLRALHEAGRYPAKDYRTRLRYLGEIDSALPALLARLEAAEVYIEELMYCGPHSRQHEDGCVSCGRRNDWEAAVEECERLGGER